MFVFKFAQVKVTSYSIFYKQLLKTNKKEIFHLFEGVEQNY